MDGRGPALGAGRATHLTLGGSLDPASTAMQRLERAVEVKRVLELELGH